MEIFYSMYDGMCHKKCILIAFNWSVFSIDFSSCIIDNDDDLWEMVMEEKNNGRQRD